jgi:hypothetical protein
MNVVVVGSNLMKLKLVTMPHLTLTGPPSGSMTFGILKFLS